MFNLLNETDKYICKDRLQIPRIQRFYPSEASVSYQDIHGKKIVLGKCLRAAYFRCTSEAGEKPTAKTEWIFLLGKTAENMMVDVWKEMGIWRANSIKWEDHRYFLSGEVDVILRNPETDQLFGVEIKSIHGYYAKKQIIGNPRQVGQPKVEHLLQTLLYLYELKHLLTHFELVYICRDDGSRTSFKIELAPDESPTVPGSFVHHPVVNGRVNLDYTVEDILSRYGELYNSIKDTSIPARDYELRYSAERIESDYAAKLLSKSKYDKWRKCKTKASQNWPGDWQCSYCPFTRLCWANAEQLEIPVESIELPGSEDTEPGTSEAGNQEETVS